MTFDEIKDIIKKLIKDLKCANCNSRYENSGIRFLAAYCCEAVFHFVCVRCAYQVIVQVQLIDGEMGEETKTMTITQNDVLDIHNFLNQFNGDFEQLFSHQS